MENNETLLTNELYESIIGDLIKEVVDLKKAQNDTISSLYTRIEILKSLKVKLKSIKKDIKESKKKISKDKASLRIINNKLNQKNKCVVDLNSNFITEGESYIDVNSFVSLENNQKKR